MIITIDVPFEYFQIVYLKTDMDQKPFIVIGVKHCADNGILIEVQNMGVSGFHYIGEIATERIVF